eukprot:1714514-Rhodomonas_salina.1
MRLGKDVLVFSHHNECACTKDQKATKDWECRCAVAEKKPLRSLVFLSHTLCEAGDLHRKDKLLKVPMIFWRGDGRAITSENSDEELPTQVTEEIQDLGVKHILKEIYKHSYLHSFQAIKREFSKLSRRAEAETFKTGTLVLISRLTSEDENQHLRVGGVRRDEKSETGDDIVVKDSDDDVSFQRLDRNKRFRVGANIPCDYSLRAYCELLFDPDTPHRRMMKIFIQNVPVEPWTVRDMCKPGSLHRFTFPARSKNGEVEEEMTLEVGFSRGELERETCGIFIYFDKEERRLPPRLIVPYSRDFPSSELTNDVGKTDGLVGRLVVGRGMRPDNGKQRFHSRDSVLEQSISLGVETKVREYFEGLFKGEKAAYKAERETWESHGVGVGRAVWARWTRRHEFFPAHVLNRWDREVARYLDKAVMKEQLAGGGGKDAFPRGPEPENLLVRFFGKEPQRVVWCKVEDLVQFDSEEGRAIARSLAKQVVPERDRVRLETAQREAEAHIAEVCEAEVEEQVQCRRCLAWRTRAGLRILHSNEWRCDQGYLLPDSGAAAH